jgi:hypothetical protein
MERVSGFISPLKRDQTHFFLPTLDKQSSCKKTTQNLILNKEGHSQDTKRLIATVFKV